MGVIGTTTTTLAVAPHATHGYADLVLTSVVDIHPGHARRVVLHYDGSAYAGEGVESWRPPIVPDSGHTH